MYYLKNEVAQMCSANKVAQICSANKSTGKTEIVLQRDEWISLFGCLNFQRYVFMLSTRFVRTSGIGFVSQNMEP